LPEGKRKKINECDSKLTTEKKERNENKNTKNDNRDDHQTGGIVKPLWAVGRGVRQAISKGGLGFIQPNLS